MKNKKLPFEAGVFASKTASHNVCVIDCQGSPTTTQIWDGGSAAAAAWVLKKIAEGNDDDNGWDQPVCHAFIKAHVKTDETRHYDLANPSHVADLSAMATATISPAS